MFTLKIFWRKRLFKFSNRRYDVPLFVPKSVLVSFSRKFQNFSLSSGPVQLTIPCYFRRCVQAQIPPHSLPGSGQPVPELINIFHTALRQQLYANHFPESLTWS